MSLTPESAMAVCDSGALLMQKGCMGALYHRYGVLLSIGYRERELVVDGGMDAKKAPERDCPVICCCSRSKSKVWFRSNW